MRDCHLQEGTLNGDVMLTACTHQQGEQFGIPPREKQSETDIAWRGVVEAVAHEPGKTNDGCGDHWHQAEEELEEQHEANGVGRRHEQERNNVEHREVPEKERQEEDERCSHAIAVPDLPWMRGRPGQSSELKITDLFAKSECNSRRLYPLASEL